MAEPAGVSTNRHRNSSDSPTDSAPLSSTSSMSHKMRSRPASAKTVSPPSSPPPSSPPPSSPSPSSPPPSSPSSSPPSPMAPSSLTLTMTSSRHSSEPSVTIERTVYEPIASGVKGVIFNVTSAIVAVEPVGRSIMRQRYSSVSPSASEVRLALRRVESPMVTVWSSPASHTGGLFGSVSTSSVMSLRQVSIPSVTMRRIRYVPTISGVKDVIFNVTSSITAAAPSGRSMMRH